MNTEPTPLQRLLVGVIGLVMTAGLGLWLTQSYFGVWTSDTKVSVQVDRLGDAIGPGAKVRYHGIIVGRVLKLSEHDAGYQLQLLVKKDHSLAIPSSATARILPSTVFGSEYVELLADRDATDRDHLASGDVIKADGSDATLRLMTSFDQAERLISAVDAEDINRITGKLAPALDGNGADIKKFLERTDRVVTDINRDLPTMWETLALSVKALDTIADIEPDLTSALGHARTTSDTIADEDKTIGAVLSGSAKVTHEADTLLAGLSDVLVPFVERLERLTGVAADNSTAVRQILTRFARTGHNGAAGIDDNAIQMIGTIGTDLPPAYTPADCARYGPTLVASNCGDPVPASNDAEKAVSASSTGSTWMDAVADRVAALLEQENASTSDDPVERSRATPTPTPRPTAGPSGLIELLLGLGSGLGDGER